MILTAMQLLVLRLDASTIHRSAFRFHAACLMNQIVRGPLPLVAVS
jgi:hypothetical protein